MEFRFIARDSAGEQLGEVRSADPRTVTPRPLNRLATASVACAADNPAAAWLAKDDDTHLEIRKDGDLLFYGPVLTHEKDRGASDRITANCTSGGWRLAKRLIGKSLAGSSYGTALAPIDRGAIAAAVLAEVNAESASGIVLGNQDPTTRGSAGPLRYYQALQAILDQAAPLDGIDFTIDPLDPLLNAGAIGQLNIYASLGTTQPNTVFAYGEPPFNVSSWRDVGDANGKVNRIYSLPSGFPDNIAAGDTVLRNADTAATAASIAAGGIREDLVQADLGVAAFRQALCDENVRIRAIPRRVITFEPTAEGLDGQVYGADYSEGDVVRFRATETFQERDSGGRVIGATRERTVDALMRIYAIAFSIDKNGKVTQTFTLVEDA